MNASFLKKVLTQTTGVLLAGVAVHWATATAPAQDTAPPEEMKPTVVTGSYIPTAETVNIQPVDTVTAADIERTGVATLELVAKKNVNAVGAGNFGVSRGNGGDGRSEISLRGIPGGTLLLINGRRTANPDLNAIPMGAIERIEILKDGGSSIYGADAVAGVVNIILKKDFQGSEMSARYGNTTDTDVGEQIYNFVTGAVTEKTSVMAGGSYYKVNSLYSADRDRSRPDPTDPAQTSPTSNPGRVQATTAPAGSPLLGGVVYRGAPGTTGTDPSQYTAFNNATDRFNFGVYTPAIRDAERYSFFGNVEQKILDEQLKFFAEGMYTHSWSYNQLAPTPAVFVNLSTPTSPGGIVVPASNPYNVFDIPINRMRYRPDELGPRIDENTYDIYRFVSGFRGQIGESRWNWEAAVLFTRDDGVNKQGNDISRTGLESAINSTDPATAFNPFGNRANSKAVLDSIRLDHYTFTRDDLFSVDGKINGVVYDLPAGALAVAVGGEFRNEKGEYTPDSSLIYDNVVGFNGAKPYTGERDVSAGFYEISIPILGGDWDVPGFHRFEINHSGRYEDYSDFGDTYNPKVGFLWKPIDENLVLRGSYSESFTAPTFGDLYTVSQESYPELRNPVKYASGDPTYFDQIRTFYSGNPELEPTTAKNYSAGIVYSPKFAKGLTLAVDYFRIEQQDVPGSVDQFILDENFRTGGPWSPTATYANLIDYDPATTNYNTLYAPTLNLSQRLIEGFDFQVFYELLTDGYGKFTFAPALTYYITFEQENIPGTGMQDRLGDFVDPSQSFGLGSLPRMKGTMPIFWSYKKLEFGVTLNYIGAYLDDVASGFYREVSDQFTVDLQLSYMLPDDFKVTVGVINVTDEEPPLVRGAFADNYDRDTHDLRGRFIYAGVSKKF